VTLAELKRLVFKNGVPDTVPGLRPVIWRLLLGMWPLETEEWERALEQTYETYQVWRQELIVQPSL